MDDIDIDYDRPCNCGDCRSCDAHAMSDDDNDGLCQRCNGAGCGTCETEEV